MRGLFLSPTDRRLARVSWSSDCKGFGASLECLSVSGLLSLLVMEL